MVHSYDSNIDELKIQVQEANNAIPRGLTAVKAITDPYLGTPDLLTLACEQINHSGPDGPETDDALVAVALVGLARCWHSAINGELQQIDAINQTKLAEPFSKELRKVRDFYQRVRLTNLLPESIHAGSTYFPAEVARDDAASYYLFGHDWLAHETLSNAKDAMPPAPQLAQQLRTFRESGPNELLAQKDYSRYLARRRTIGQLSALSVLYLRAGIYERNHAYFEQAVELQLALQSGLLHLGLDSAQYASERNNERLIYVAGKTAKEIGFPRNSRDLKIQVKAFLLGLYRFA